MCGRVGQIKDEAYLAQRFTVDLKKLEIPINRNIPPSSDLPAVRLENGKRILELQHWGIQTPWKKGSLNLAQGEGVAMKQTFADSFNERPSFVISNFWFEWRPDAQGKKLPYLFRRRDGESFALAAIWKPQRQDGQLVHSCVILTTAASPRALLVHKRMPAVLSVANEGRWIDTSVPPEERLTMIQGLPESDMVIYPVSPKMNYAGYNDPEGFEPAGDPL